jgi:hypothetical protein
MSPGVKILYISESPNINGLYTPVNGLSASMLRPATNFNPLTSYQAQYGKFNIVNMGSCAYTGPTQTPTPSPTKNPYTSPTPTPSPTQTSTVTQTTTRTPTPTRTQNFNPTTVISLSGINAAFTFRNAYNGLEQLVFTNGILTGHRFIS